MGLFDLADEIDMNEVEEATFDLIPAGTYAATVSGIGDYEKDGKKALTFDYTITEDPEHDGKYVGRSIREFKSYTVPSDENYDPKGLGFIKSRFMSLGMPKDFQGLPDREDFLNLDVIIKIKHNPDKKDSSIVYANVQSVELDRGAASSGEADSVSVGAATSATVASDDDNPFA